MSSEESELEWDQVDLNNTSYNQELSNSDYSLTKFNETVNEIVAALQPSDEGEWESASSGEQSDDTQLDTLDENPQTQSPSASSTPAKSRKFSVIKAGSVENLIDKIEQKSKPEGPKTRSNTRKTRGVSITKSRGVTEIGRLDPTTSSKYKSAKARQSFEKSKLKAKTKQKSAKMGDESKYNTHRLIYADAKEQADAIIASVNAELAKAQRSQQDMQTLDGNYNNLIGLKSRMKRSSDNLENCIQNVGAASDSWTDFLTLARCYVTLEGTVNQAITNAKLVIDLWHKDNIVLDAERIPIPSFYGVFGKYVAWKASFLTLTKSLGKDSKKIRLVEACKGEAAERIQHAVTGGQDFDTIWKNLDDYYGNPKNLADATISGLFNLKLQSQDIKEVVKHFNAYRGQATTVLTLGHNAEQLLVAYYLLQLPMDIRAKVEGALVDKKKSKLSFEDVAPAIDEVGRFNTTQLADEGQVLGATAGIEDVTAAPGLLKHQNDQKQQKGNQNYKNKGYNKKGRGGHRQYNHNQNQNQVQNQNNFAQNQNNYGQNQIGQNQNYNYAQNQNNYGQGQNYNNQNNYGHGQNYNQNNYGHYQNTSRNQGQYQNNQFCFICGSQAHPWYFCNSYTHGPEMRKRLKSQGRCEACCMRGDRHDPKQCLIKYNCVKCDGKHQTITCGGANDTHPGSNILEKK